MVFEEEKKNKSQIISIATPLIDGINENNRRRRGRRLRIVPDTTRGTAKVFWAIGVRDPNK